MLLARLLQPMCPRCLSALTAGWCGHWCPIITDTGYKVSDVARSVHAVVPGNRAAITLATTRFLHTCTMIPLKFCSSQAVEKDQISGGVDSQFVLTWHVLCETERPRLAADLAQARGPDGEVPCAPVTCATCAGGAGLLLVWSGESSGGWREEDWRSGEQDEVYINAQVLAWTVV